MSNSRRLKNLKDFCSHMTIDQVWKATPKSFNIDFEEGGTLDIKVVDGKLHYTITLGEESHEYH